MTGGKEGDEQADGDDGEGGEEDVAGLDEYGVGVDQVVAGHLDEAELLLGEGEGGAGNEAHYEAAEADEPALEDEDAPDEAAGGAEGVQGLYVVFFLYDEHRKRAVDVEGHYEHYKDEYQEDSGFLVLHHLKEIPLLLLAPKQGALRSVIFLEAPHGPLAVVFEIDLDPAHQVVRRACEGLHNIQRHNEQAGIGICADAHNAGGRDAAA